MKSPHRSRRPIASARFLAAGLAVSLVVVAALAAPLHAAPSIGPSFEGHLQSYGHKTISFEVRRIDGRNASIRFSVKNLPLVCFDHSERKSFGPDRLKFINQRTFQGQRYRRLTSDRWSYYEVRGRLLANGRARGYVLYYEGTHGPHQEPDTDCTTGGDLYFNWKARRVG